MTKSSAALVTCLLGLLAAVLWLCRGPGEAAAPPAPAAADEARTGSAVPVSSGPGDEVSQRLPGRALDSVTTGCVTGRLLLVATGAPAAGVEVLGLQRAAADPAPRLSDLAGAPPVGAFAVAARAVSAADGRFVLQDLDRIAYLRLRIGSGTDLEQAMDVEQLLPTTVALDLGDLWLEATARLLGRVLAADGAPVAGAAVGVSANPTTMSRLPGAAVLLPGPPPVVLDAEDAVDAVAVRTDAEGRFAISGVAPGPRLLAVQAGSCAAHSLHVLPRAGQSLDVGEIRLGDVVAVAGRLHLADGRPLAGAQLACALPSQLVRVGLGAGHPLAAGVCTDADGRFRLLVPTDAPFLVAVQGSAAPCWEVLGPMSAAAVKDLCLPDRAGIQLVLRSADGTSVGSPRAFLEPCAERGESLDPQASLLGFAAALRRAVGAAPRSVRAAPVHGPLQHVSGQPGTWRLAGLPPGDHRLFVEVEGCVPAAGWVRTAAGREGRLELILQRAVERRFEVRDTAGRPVVGARLYWLPSAPATAADDQVCGQLPPSPLPILVGCTDAAGNLSSTQLGADAASFLVLHDDHVPLPVAGTAARGAQVELTLHRCGRIHGHVAATTPASLVVVAKMAAGSAAGSCVDVASQRALVGSDGGFVLDGLAPGRWELSLLPKASSAAESMSPVPGQMAPALAVSQAVVEPGACTTVALQDGSEATGGSLHGEVFVGGNPASGMIARLVRSDRGDADAAAATGRARAARWSELGQAVRIDPQGRFRFAGLPAGDYELSVAEPGLASCLLFRERLRVEGPGTRLQRHLELPLHTFTALVVDAASHPIAGAQVLLVGRERAGEVWRGNGLQLRARTDSAGRAVFGCVPAGTYELSGRCEARELLVPPVQLAIEGEAERQVRAVGRR